MWIESKMHANDYIPLPLYNGNIMQSLDDGLEIQLFYFWGAGVTVTGLPVGRIISESP